jgi:hypothetical protein
VVVTPVARLAKDTVALATTAPDLSLMVPEIVPPTTCPCTGREHKMLSSRASATTAQLTTLRRLSGKTIYFLLADNNVNGMMPER